MKKICYVVTVPVTIKAFFVPQLKYLAEQNFDVTVICSKDDNLQAILGSKITYIPLDVPRGIDLKNSISVIRKLIKIFKEHKFDIVQYSTPNAAMYASIAAKRAGIKIRNYHLMGLRYLGAHGFGRFVLKNLERISCVFSTSIECVSQSNLELGVKERIFKRKKAIVIWNGSTGGVDLERFDYSKRPKWREEVRAELGYKKDDFVYGFVGRITKDKGIEELIKAYNMLENNSKLFFVGDLEGRHTIDENLLSDAMQNKNIQFHPPVSDVERYFAAIDVLILPSYREGFGNVVIEAGAMGTPAIVSDIPGPIDTIQVGKTAYTFEVKNVEQLAYVMNQIKQEDYLTMGKNAAEYVSQNFDSKMLNTYILNRKRELLSLE